MPMEPARSFAAIPLICLAVDCLHSAGRGLGRSPRISQR
jgi:hypothetical protein